MIQLTLIIPDQGKNDLPLPDGNYHVGAASDTNIQLPYPGVSKHHCMLSVKGDSLEVQDTNSSNGTFVNEKQTVPGQFTPVYKGDTIRIGNLLFICEKGMEHPKQSEPVNKAEEPQNKIVSAPPISAADKIPEKIQLKDGEEVPVLKISGIPQKAMPFVQEIKKHAHEELLKRLNLKRLAMTGNTSEEDLSKKAADTIHEVLSDLNIPLPPGVTIDKLEKDLFHEAIGLGPLEELIARDDISEIMVNGPDQVYVEHKGVLYKTDTCFADNQQVLAAIERIVSPLGRRIDESSPMVDARLKDGSRVNAIIPPLSLVGPTITIRKFSKNPLQVKDLIRFGSISQEIADFLDVCVKIRKNIIISGGTGSGKTTLLNILSGFLPNRERIVTIEDAAELQLRQEHVVRLESRPANIEGKGEINIRDLVKNSLRMRPDRIVIGECRGGEALDMLQAMNTGHDGSLTTIHANAPRDALSRLETLVLMSGFDLPLRAIREQIASAIAIIVQINREKDGSRKVTYVSEITKMEGDIITMQDIFVYKQDGWTPEGKMTGSYIPTGNIPTFMDEIKRAGLPFDISMFTPPKTQGGGTAI